MKRKTRQPRSKPGQRRERVAALVIAILIGLAWAIVHTRSKPASIDPPPIPTSSFEPVIADLIQQSLAKVKASPRSGPAWGELGMILMVYDLASQARFCFTQAEDLAPGEPLWPYLQGLLLLPDAAAVPRLTRAAELCKDGPKATISLIRLAHAMTEHGLNRQASEQFRKLPPNHPAALLGLANLSLATGTTLPSTNSLQPALTDPHTARGATLLLASIQQRAGDAAAAQLTLRQARSLPPDKAWPDPFLAETDPYRHGKKLLADRIQELLQSGQPAATLIDRLIAEYPQAPEGWLHLGQMHLDHGDCPAAEKAFRQHLLLQASSVNGLSLLGTTLLCQERYLEAAEAFAQATQLKPDFGQAHFNLGFARARAGRAVESIDSFRQAIRYNPEFVDSYILLADLLAQLGQKVEAQRLLQQARQLAPADPRIQALMERIQP